MSMGVNWKENTSTRAPYVKILVGTRNPSFLYVNNVYCNFNRYIRGIHVKKVLLDENQ